MSYPVYYKKDITYTAIPYTYNTANGALVPTPPVTPPPTTTPVQLKVVGATATASETGNGPENVLDTSETTRWSAQGIGKSLSLDLGGTQEISQIDITWYQGNQRQAKADILVDNTKITSITSDGVNPSTRITFPTRQGKIVTIVGNGNNVNDWNSITTVKVFGKQLVEPGTGPITPPPPSAGGLDAFGIKMIYPTKLGGRVFNAPLKTGNQRTLSSNQRDGTSDLKPLGSGTYTIYPDIGEMKMSGNAPRAYVFDEQRAKFFENVEITCYYKCVSTTSSIATGYQGFEISCRGQHELAGTNARVYYSRHSLDGRWWRLKEDVHPTSKDISVSSGNAFTKGNWYGMKFIVRTVGNRDVRMESYRDTTGGQNGGNWVKMFDFTDLASNPWAGYPIYKPSTPNCACRSSFIRTDNSIDFRVKNWSIREVDALP